jgi:hypothetical protein
MFRNHYSQVMLMYKSLGGLPTLLNLHAETVYAALVARQKAAMKAGFAGATFIAGGYPCCLETVGGYRKCQQ